MTKGALILWIICWASIGSFGQDTTRLSLLFAGDVMQHDSQIAGAVDSLGHYDYEYCFRYVRPIIESADVAVANLELTFGGPPYQGYPRFSAPDELAGGLKAAGFDVLVTANNHCLDRGSKGLARTIRVLDSAAFLHTGTFLDSGSRRRQTPLIIESKGVKLALLNYTYGTNGIPLPQHRMVNVIDTTVIKRDLKTAREVFPDLIIVFFHWGLEYQSQPNATQQQLAAFCQEHGASLVIGSHPHVLQPIQFDTVAHRAIAYSLGNFVSGQRQRYRDGGAMLHVNLEQVVSDSSRITQITEVSYDLVWVKVDAKKRYTILPVQEFERDSIMLKKDIGRFNTFVADSKLLMNSSNNHVGEVQRELIDSLAYRIWIANADDSIAGLASSERLAFYGFNKTHWKDSIVWLTGKFFDMEVAQQALAELRVNFKQAKLIEYRWGKRKEVALPPRKQDAD